MPWETPIHNVMNTTEQAAACALKHASSQLSEDLLLLPTLLAAANWRPSTFVELGALDGIQMSNTLMLERCFGWSGLLIEGSPKNFAKLQNSPRSAAKKVHSAICDAPGVLQFASEQGPRAGQVGAAAMDARIGRALSARGASGGNNESRVTDTVGRALSAAGGGVTVPCNRLDSLMAEHMGPSSSPVGFLSLDVEGAEEFVLRTVSPASFRVVIVERSAFDAAKNARVHALMRAAGMRLAPRMCVRASNIYLAPHVAETLVAVPSSSPYRTARGLVRWRPSLSVLMHALDASRHGVVPIEAREHVANARHDECVAVESYGGPMLHGEGVKK